MSKRYFTIVCAGCSTWYRFSHAPTALISTQGSVSSEVLLSDWQLP